MDGDTLMGDKSIPLSAGLSLFFHDNGVSNTGPPPKGSEFLLDGLNRGELVGREASSVIELGNILIVLSVCWVLLVDFDTFVARPSVGLGGFLYRGSSPFFRPVELKTMLVE